MAVLFGLPLLDYEVEGYQLYTGRTETPQAPAREAWVVAERLGNDVQTLLRHCVHVLPGQREEVAATLDELLFGDS